MPDPFAPDLRARVQARLDAELARQQRHLDEMGPDVHDLTDAIAFIDTEIAALPSRVSSFVTKPHSLLLVLPPRPVAPDLSPSDYAYLRSRMLAVAKAYPDHVAFLDASEYFPRLEDGGDATLGLTVETTNPKTLSRDGHRYLAEILAGALT